MYVPTVCTAEQTKIAIKRALSTTIRTPESAMHLHQNKAESADLDHFIEWIFSNDKQIEASTDYNKG